MGDKSFVGTPEKKKEKKKKKKKKKKKTENHRGIPGANLTCLAPQDDFNG